MGLLEYLAGLADTGKRNVKAGLLDPELFATRVAENARDWSRGLLNGDRKSVIPEVRASGRREQMDAASQLFGGGITKAGKATKRELTQYQRAHAEAQRNAALPVEQGGLGLPPDNTAMDRARAMGFDTPAYHGAGKDIPEFTTGNKSAVGGAPNTMTWAAKAPSVAEGYAIAHYPAENPNVLPLLINLGKNVAKDMKGKSYKQVQSTDSLAGYHFSRGADSVTLKNFNDPGIPGYPGFTDHTAIKDPSNIRSRFAAFDPKKRGSSDLLASMGLLGLLGGGMYGQGE